MVAHENRRFADRVVIVTGALGGIGSATARRFAREGARLVLVDLQAGELPETGEHCAKLGAPSVLSLSCDVSDERQVGAVCEAAFRRFGRLDVVANIAGAMIYKKLEDLTGQDWMRVLGINLMGSVYFTRDALSRMTSGGSIVNVSSIHAFQTSPLVAPYAAAKAALLSLTRSTAIEGRAKGVRANAVLPGAIDTPMLHSSPNIQSGTEVLSPQNIGNPEDIAAAIAFLASEESAFVNGACLCVDGGRLAAL